MVRSAREVWWWGQTPPQMSASGATVAGRARQMQCAVRVETQRVFSPMGQGGEANSAPNQRHTHTLRVRCLPTLIRRRGGSGGVSVRWPQAQYTELCTRSVSGTRMVYERERENCDKKGNGISPGDSPSLKVSSEKSHYGTAPTRWEPPP